MKRALVHLSSAAVFAIVLAFPALAQAQPRVVAVTGHATMPFTPDWVDLEFAVIARSADFAKAQAADLAAVEAALGRLTGSFGLRREDIATTDWSLSEQPVYADGQETGREYVALTRMRARVRDLGSYKAIVLALLGAGANGIDSIRFGVDDEASLREKALVAALADAERMAKALAVQGRATLGRPLQVREAAPGQPAPVLFAKAISASGGEVISSGGQSVEASVYVEYELR